MYRLTFFRSGCLLLLVSFSSTGEGFAGVIYKFVNVADSTGTFRAFTSPAINRHGDVAFRALHDDLTVQSIQLRGRSTQQLAISGVRGQFLDGAPTQPLATFSPETSINSDGTVAFGGSYDVGGYGVFRNGGPNRFYPVEVAYPRSPPGRYSDFQAVAGAPAINDRDDTVYLAVPRDFPVLSIYGHVPAVPVPVHVGAGPSDTFGRGIIDLNNNRQVAFYEVFSNIGVRGIFTQETGAIGSRLTTIADQSDGFLDFGRYGVSINDRDVVAFHALPDAGGQQILFGSAGSPLSVVAGTPEFTSIDDLSPPSINDANTVAFLGSTTTAIRGIFTGSGAATDLVLALGDPLFGSQVADIGLLARQSINVAGQLSFEVELTDGRNVVVRADPMGSTAAAAISEFLGVGSITNPYELMLNCPDCTPIYAYGLGTAAPLHIELPGAESWLLELNDVPSNAFTSINFPMIPNSRDDLFEVVVPSTDDLFRPPITLYEGETLDLSALDRFDITSLSVSRVGSSRDPLVVGLTLADAAQTPSLSFSAVGGGPYDQSIPEPPSLATFAMILGALVVFRVRRRLHPLTGPARPLSTHALSPVACTAPRRSVAVARSPRQSQTVKGLEEVSGRGDG